jgi:hypothetical protein
MDRQQILDLYDWAPGICFRHPERGEVPTAVMRTLHPRGQGEYEVRACEDCVVAIRDARREASARLAAERRPGHSPDEAG